MASDVQSRLLIPQRGRLLLFGGLGFRNLAAPNRIVITTRVQERCRVDRLYVVAREGVNGSGVEVPRALYVVAEIKVGTTSQLSTGVPIPAGAFSPDGAAMVRGLHLDTLQPGISFTLFVDFPGGWAVGSTARFVAFATALR